MPAAIIIASTSIILSLITGYVVWSKNLRKQADIVYLVTSLSYVLLSAANLLSTITNGTTKLFYARLVMGFSLLGLVLTYELVETLKNPHKSGRFRLTQKYVQVVLVLALAFCLTPYVLKGFSSEGTLEKLQFGWGIGVFGLIFGFYLTAGILSLIRGILNSSDQNIRSQCLYMLVGFLPVIVLAPITGMYLPAARGDLRFIIFTPIYTAFFVMMVGYAMIKSKLFDVKVYVVRGVGYTFASLFLGIIYIAPLLYIFSVLTGIEILLWRFILAVVVFSIGATYYATLQNWFRNVSRRLFFQDAYESTEVLSQLNHELLSVVDIESIFHETNSLIAASIKPEYSFFVLHSQPQKKGGYRFIGAPTSDLNQISRLLSNVAKVKENIVVTSFYDKNSSTYLMASRQDIAVIVKIISSVSDALPVGYLVLGQKKSGNMYNQQDVQMLSTISNTLVISIQNALHFEEIQNFNVTLQERIEEATRKLRATNDKLKRLDETKDEFISMASHQLRTPLTSIKGYLSMVLEGDAGKLNPQQTDMLKQSFMSSQRMVNLIADLLNLSRLNTGKFVIQNTPTDLRTIVDQEVQLLQEAAAAKNIQLNFTMPKTFAVLPLDENKIHQVVMNFVDNAIYYTPPGGTVDVSLVETPTTVEFRVKDSGIGVPRSVQHHLFTKFYRAENAKRARPDGTGLGLFMAKKVVTAQGGAVTFESQEGKGSTFGFRFTKKVLMERAENTEPVTA